MEGRPALDLDVVREHELAYTVVDVSAEGLAKAPAGYEKVQADVSGPLPDGLGQFDLVFSTTLAEHVRGPPCSTATSCHS